MARDRGKKALYEVMSKGRIKPGTDGTLKQKQPKRPDEDRPPVDKPTVDKPAVDKPAVEEKSPTIETPDVAAQWWKKPRTVQFNAGRIEFSMPFQLAVALLLGLILLVLVAFRLGQLSRPTGQETFGPAEEVQMQKIDRESPAERTTIDAMQRSVVAEDISPGGREVGPAELTGSNVIVLVEYEARADLEPVQAHFAQYGIETEIVAESGRYFLMTKDRYDNPAKAGTDGYNAKQRIIEVGAEYEGKAPAGYETFAPHFFRDAYGKKVN